MAVSTVLLLLLVIPRIQPKATIATVRTRVAIQAESPVRRIVGRYAQPLVSAVAPPTPPRPSLAVAPVLPPPTPSPDLVLIEQQARLRHLTDYAGAAELQSEAARTWKGSIFVVPHAVAPSALAPRTIDRVASPSAADTGGNGS